MKMNEELDRDEKIAAREQARRDLKDEEGEEEFDFERDMGDRQS